MSYPRSAMILLLFAASALLLTSCAGVQMGDRTPSAGAGAAGGPSDPLQACLSKIPADASAGQRAMAEQTCHRNADSRDAVVDPGSAAATSRAASGHAGDTLQACLARIPKDASSGQRMIAEDGCQRADAARKAVGAP